MELCYDTKRKRVDKLDVVTLIATLYAVFKNNFVIIITRYKRM